jgi:plasmid replication initiation protein
VQGYAVAEHDFATVWDVDVLIWVMSQIFAAQDPGFPTSHIFQFTACQLLIAVARANGNAEYQLLNGALTPPRTTGIRTTFGAPGRSPGPTNGDS